MVGHPAISCTKVPGGAHYEAILKVSIVRYLTCLSSLLPLTYVFSTFKKLYNHHHYITPEHFHHVKIKLQTISSYSLPLCPPVPGNH